MRPTFALFGFSTVASAATLSGDLASTPPLGWNSWDCWKGPGNETRLLEAAEAFSEILRPAGYDTMTVDMGWYYEDMSVVAGRKTGSLNGAQQPMHIDEWGRLIAHPTQWPDGISGAVKQLHARGLKMGIHVMRGINHAALDQNTPVLDTLTGKASGYFARDIVAMPRQSCQWCDDYFSVNTSHPGAKLWYSSNAELYKEFGVDVLKADCYYGKRDEHDAELQMFADSIAESGAEILISLSPGVNAVVEDAGDISAKVNMYRISDDLWDCWNDESDCSCDDGIRVTQQFERLRAHQAAGLIGAEGYLGRSWPDADMMPLGDLFTGPSELSDGEQRVVMTLWSIARAPMVVGADPVKLRTNLVAQATIANPEVVRIGQEATDSWQISRSGATGPWGPGAHVAWAAALPRASDGRNRSALALFNLGEDEASIGVALPGDAPCDVRDVWARQATGSVRGHYSQTLPPRSAAMVLLTGCGPPTETAHVV